MASTRLGDGVTGDAELIAAVRTGDAASFGTLYERHAGAAWVVARQYTDSRADADDVVADAFTAVHAALQNGNGPESAFRAYLFTVVRTAAISAASPVTPSPSRVLATTTCSRQRSCRAHSLPQRMDRVSRPQTPNFNVRDR